MTLRISHLVKLRTEWLIRAKFDRKSDTLSLLKPSVADRNPLLNTEGEFSRSLQTGGVEIDQNSVIRFCMVLFSVFFAFGIEQRRGQWFFLSGKETDHALIRDQLMGLPNWCMEEKIVGDQILRRVDSDGQHLRPTLTGVCSLLLSKTAVLP